MPELYDPIPNGGHPPPQFGIPNYIFRSIALPGYLVGDVAVLFDGTFYEWDGDSWNSLSISGGGAGGTTQIATGTSDPVGSPASGIVLFARTDIVRVLQWNGSAWVVVVSET